MMDAVKEKKIMRMLSSCLDPDLRDKLLGRILIGARVIVVFTGAPQGTRKMAYGYLLRLGVIIKPQITRATNILVVGKRPGSKLEKAHKRGIPTLTEAQFYELINLMDESDL